jgi:MFS family permease
VADRAAWRLLAGLSALNVLGYVDRQLLASIAPVLMAELRLSRAAIGLLVGPAFVVVYALSTLGLGAAADRWSRTRIVAAGLAVWSAATAVTGAAVSLSALAVCRALVGVGEATLPPAALSLIGERFPRERTGLASAVYYAGIPIGYGCSLALAGWLVPRFGWRAAFVLLGLLGLSAVALVARTSDSRRPQASAPPATGQPAAARLVAALAADRELTLLVAGACLLTYASASSQHLMTWLVQERGFAYARAAHLAALVVLSAGLAGNLGVGALTDRAGRRQPARRLAAFASLGAAGLAAAAVFYTAPAGSVRFYAAWAVAQAWLLGWYGPLLAVIHDRSPVGSRATVLGFALMALNLVGVGLGPWLTGVVGDRASLTQGLLESVAVGAVGLVLVAGVAWRARASRRA